MRRRDVLIGSVMAAALGSITQQAIAQTAQPLRVAVLSAAGPNELLEALRAELRHLGSVEGRDVVLEYWFARGQVDQLPALAESLLRQGGTNLAAIVAESSPAAVAAQRATTTIPIVAVVAVDPVGSGLATSLARPGANITGVTLFAEEMNTKRVELISTFPSIRRLGVVSSGLSGASGAAENLRSVQQASRALGIEAESVQVSGVSALRDLLNSTALTEFDGFVVLPDIILTSRAAEVVALLGATHRPAIYTSRAWVKAGGLISLGPDVIGAYRSLAQQLKRVLSGEWPGNLPFDRPVKFELAVNLKTARTLGIELPSSVLLSADEIID